MTLPFSFYHFVSTMEYIYSISIPFPSILLPLPPLPRPQERCYCSVGMCTAAFLATASAADHMEVTVLSCV